ncbi:MAG: ABC transporter permease [Candidatus Limnocylindrales bacterium]
MRRVSRYAVADMAWFLVRRLAANAIVVVGVAFIVFALVFLASDPVRALLPLDAPPAAVESLRQNLGFNQPVPIQFLGFLGRALHGDFGTSTRTLAPALGMVLGRMPATLSLGVAGVGVSLLISMPLGILAAARPGSWVDLTARTVAIAGQAVPGFVLGQVLILVVGVAWRLLPVSGSGDPTYLILPAIVVGVGSAAGLTRILRASLLDVLGTNYIVTARAKGLGPRRVILRHALRNAAIPFVTFLAFDLAAIVSGVIIVEVVFSYPGMGLLVVQAVTNRDLPVIQAFTFVTAVTIVTINLGLDVVYGLLDPRIRLG